jgi:aspartyl-tRNA(Asn)/glutamyl-tRNA(Gln) amidotransferase subunit A
MTLQEAREALGTRRISVRELTIETLQRIERLNPHLNALITVTQENALRRADALDAEFFRAVTRGPLWGIPIVHKDCLFTAGVRTTAGSRIFADFVPDRDATAVARLDHAGAVMLGKAGMHELAYGVTSNNPHYGAVRNPWDIDRIPGGSSGGSAAAVAAGLALVATGTDTGGSIRIPASFCGVVGLKPTYDRVDRRGVLPLAVTLDHVGPLARTVRDAAAAFGAMAPPPVGPGPYGEIGADTSLVGVRIGIPKNYFFDRADAEVADAVRNAARVAETLGAQVTPVCLPDVEALNVVGRVVQLSEASAVLVQYLNRRADFGPDVLALIEQGRLIPATDYVNAQRSRSVLAGDFAQIWANVDCLIAPVTPVLPPRIGQMSVIVNGTPEDVRIACTRLARPLNVLGWPTLAMPCGFSRSGLPIGMQWIAAPWQEDLLFRVGAALEEALGPAGRHPSAKS